jgi:Fibronectin type III domain
MGTGTIRTILEAIVTVPVTGDLLPTPESGGRLAGFLRDLTGGQAADDIYAIIEERVQLSDHDERMDGLPPTAGEFTAVWDALLDGIRPRPAAWDCVVLPVVVAFSDATNVKAHLELAASFWVAATAPAALAPAPPVEPTDMDHAAEVEPGIGVPAEAVRVEALPPPLPVGRGRAVALIVALLVLAGTVAILWLQGVPVAHPSGLDSGAVPSREPAAEEPTPVPVSTPSAEGTAPTAPTANTGQPAPSPSWAGPGPATAPGPPAGLAVIRVTMTTIMVGWRAPSDTGSGGVAYYRIILNGQDHGWTSNTAATINGLAPATPYTIAIVAYNAAGLASPPCDPITATTAPAPLPHVTPSPKRTVVPTGPP